MAILVNLWSGKTGEIKRFLERYYQKKVKMDEDVGQWIYIYNKPLDAIDIMSALMDNNDEFQISLCIQVDKADVHLVTHENYNDIIKGLLYLFYEESPEVHTSSDGCL
ncbi:MAG: hypothetical protein N2484_01765 [Clostridia bacterium]|nr:hypothetical protein [Clostridia bacterium]